MEKFELGIALQKIYEFIWEEFCDWYIELVKPRLYDKDDETRLEAQYVLKLCFRYCHETSAPVYAVYYRGDLPSPGSG